jgi:hypothetical protein
MCNVSAGITGAVVRDRSLRDPVPEAVDDSAAEDDSAAVVSAGALSPPGAGLGGSLVSPGQWWRPALWLPGAVVPASRRHRRTRRRRDRAEQHALLTGVCHAVCVLSDISGRTDPRGVMPLASPSPQATLVSDVARRTLTHLTPASCQREKSSPFYWCAQLDGVPFVRFMNASILSGVPACGAVMCSPCGRCKRRAAIRNRPRRRS